VELVSHGVVMLNNGLDADEEGGADISDAPFEDMKDIGLAASFLSGGGGAMPMDSNGLPWVSGSIWRGIPAKGARDA
jgi:Mn-containing catalase